MKLFFFIRNLRAFCIYFLQVLKIRIWGHLLFAGIAFKIYLLMPSNFDEKIPFDYDWFCPLKTMAFINLKALPSANTFHCFLREKTVYFSDEVFSLRFRGYFKQQCGQGERERQNGQLIPTIFKFQSPKCIFWDRNETETKQKP